MSELQFFKNASEVVTVVGFRRFFLLFALGLILFGCLEPASGSGSPDSRREFFRNGPRDFANLTEEQRAAQFSEQRKVAQLACVGKSLNESCFFQKLAGQPHGVRILPGPQWDALVRSAL